MTISPVQPLTPQLRITRNSYERIFFNNYLFIIPLFYLFRAVLFYLMSGKAAPEFTDGIKVLTEASVLLLFFFADRYFRAIAPELMILFSDRALISPEVKNHTDAQFFQAIETQFNSSMRFVWGAIMAAAALAYYTLNLGGVVPVLTFWKFGVAIGLYVYLNIIPNAIYAYFLGLVLWKVYVSLLLLRSLPNKFNIQVQFDHPDEAGGLLPIGSLALQVIYVFLAPTLTSVFILIGPTIQLLTGVKIPITDRQVILKFSAVVLILSVLGSIAGIELIFRFHKVMRSQYNKVIERLNSLSRDVVELREMSIAQAQNVDIEVLKTNAEKTAVLVQLYQQQKMINCWPINQKILKRLLTSQSFLLGQIIALWNILAAL